MQLIIDDQANKAQRQALISIVLPEGFEYKEAEMGNTVSLRATSSDPLSFKHENCYAQLVDFDWTNAA